jgi:hypothetical protein
MSDNIILSHQPICPHPVFVVGSSRSGTTIMALSLIQHSHFWASAESYFLRYIADDSQLSVIFTDADVHPFGTHWLQEQNVDRREFLEYLGLGMNALYTSKSGGKRWLDATPAYTQMITTIAELFPGALFIYILRDGRNVVNSLMNFRRSKAGWANKFEAACETWSKAVTIGMDFAANNPSRCLVVRNEQIASSPELAFGRILGFLKAPPEAGPARFWRNNRINSSFDRGSVGRSLQPLEIWQAWTPEQRRTFLATAGETLALYGFASIDEMNAMESDADVVPSEDELEHRRLVSKVRAIASETLPDGADVLVVSKGDSALVHLEGKHGHFFPAGDDGSFVGVYPTDSQEAVDLLESRRSRGAQYLLLPSTAFWWLDFYPGFRQHLENCYHALVQNDACVIFALQKPPSNGSSTSTGEA